MICFHVSLRAILAFDSALTQNVYTYQKKAKNTTVRAQTSVPTTRSLIKLVN